MYVEGKDSDEMHVVCGVISTVVVYRTEGVGEWISNLFAEEDVHDNIISVFCM